MAGERHTNRGPARVPDGLLRVEDPYRSCQVLGTGRQRRLGDGRRGESLSRGISDMLRNVTDPMR